MKGRHEGRRTDRAGRAGHGCDHDDHASNRNRINPGRRFPDQGRPRDPGGFPEDSIVLPHVDLTRRPVAGAGTSKVAGPTSTSTSRSPSQTCSPRSEPVAHDDRCVRTGSEVRQDHCRHPHGEPRHVCLLTVDLETRTVRDGATLAHFSCSLSWPILFGQTDLKSSEPLAPRQGAGFSSKLTRIIGSRHVLSHHVGIAQPLFPWLAFLDDVSLCLL